jgi:hypothetical protein
MKGDPEDAYDFDFKAYIKHKYFEHDEINYQETEEENLILDEWNKDHNDD